jgi:hypothetical protein
MDKAKRTRWAPALIAAAAIVIVIVVAALVTSRPQKAPTPPVTPEKAAVSPPRAPTPIPLPPPPLSRSDLIAAAAQAASAYAKGDAYPSQNKAMVGRRFQLAIPFGCAGPSATPSTAPARWNFDLKAKTITLTAEPQIWTQTPWVQAVIGKGDYELVQGFWIPRPWVSTESCPVARSPLPGEPPPAPVEPSVGLVRVVSADASRIGERGEQPYQVVRKASDEQLATTAHEYRLVLGGRVAVLGSGDPVRCFAAGIDQRPICLIGAEIDRVAFEDPASGEVLAEWTR